MAPQEERREKMEGKEDGMRIEVRYMDKAGK